ncbi:MAG: relaxase/mobilization nuclease domain-containing protein [Clostridia bacterium]|nr:relaxase/mobilization nuclease domain-containing protein [Clostridia bacterium]
MATCNYIQAKKQNQSSMRAVIRYVSQDAKTLDEGGRRYLSGINCSGESTYDEFMATKNLYGKQSGIFYYHYEQSFVPDEISDYNTAHEIGRQLAEEMFPDFEVLVATHLDAYDTDGRQRVHNHFVINSVSFSNGKKLDYGPYTLEKMRRISDRLCRENGLSTLNEYKQCFTSKGLGTREYRAATEGNSWKFKLICTIEKAMTVAATKDDFIALMESEGYSVTWTDSRKYITYTCPDGKKVRDNKLHELKFLKENMQNEFTIRSQTIKQYEHYQAKANDGGNDADSDADTVSADSIRHSPRGLGGISDVYEDDVNVSANTIQQAHRATGNGSYGGGLERDDGSAERMVKPHEPASDGDSEQHSAESTGDSSREQGASLTGWEDARTIFLSAQHQNSGSAGSYRGHAIPNEEMDNMLDSGEWDSQYSSEYGDMSFDEIKDDTDTQDPYDAYDKTSSPSLHGVETDALYFIGGLLSLEKHDNTEDCTTMPKKKRKRDKHEWEQSM